MSWGIVGSVGGTILGSVITSSGAQSAADTQAQGARDAAAISAAAQKPWVDAGTKALGRLDVGLQPGGEYTKKFSMADAINSPAEQFALKEGTQAIQNSAAAKGGLLSTNTLQDLTKFGQGNAAQFENQAFNQWMQQQTQQLNAQQSLAQVGQSATNITSDVGANAALAGAGAQAGAQMAGTNATVGAIGKIGDILGQSGIFKPDSFDQAWGGAVGSATGTTPSSLNPYSLPSGDQLDRMSDERLKENARLVGHTMDGLPIYTYNMRGGGPRQMGVMAQDVEKVNPSAVKKNRAGYRMVDYRKVT